MMLNELIQNHTTLAMIALAAFVGVGGYVEYRLLEDKGHAYVTWAAGVLVTVAYIFNYVRERL
jgi:hypothetical protein